MNVNTVTPERERSEREDVDNMINRKELNLKYGQMHEPSPDPHILSPRSPVLHHYHL